MLSYKTHLTLLADSAARYPSRPVFRTPILDSRTKQVSDWATITYQQFQLDVEHFARYWLHTLRGLPQRSVVGVWLGGLSYVDLVHIYGLIRAGFIPQLFSLRLPNPDMIYELLQKSKGRALIFDGSSQMDMSQGSVPAHPARDVRGMDLHNVPLPALVKPSKGTDTIMIFHTSGSTSGSPKLIPCSYAWLDFNITKAAYVGRPLSQKQDVTVWMGSVCHLGQNFMLLCSLLHGSCTIQPTKIDFDSDELMHMATKCGLNRLNQFPSFLSIHLRASRQNPKVLGLLRGLDEIFYSGGLLPREDEEWAYKHDMPIRVCFGNTESTVMLLSQRGGARPSPPLRPLDGVKYGFFPTAVSSADAHSNANAQFVELVILGESADCPDPSLRAPDGHYHTGDLFQEVAPGQYVARGRDDDWIKSATSLRCDTRSIEDNVRATCADLIADCIVVGNGRPSPALFVEAKGAADPEKLKRDIIRRTRQFHARRYLHERITSPNMVLVVPAGTLPRTASKGNVRRKAVEDMFKTELDRIFAA